ncbi:hypothetical protein MRX96_045855, partial [Rhipicephalus microplus]
LSRLSEATSPAPCRPQCRGGPARCRGAFPRRNDWKLHSGMPNDWLLLPCQSALWSCRRRPTGPQLSRAPPAGIPRLSFVQALSSHPGVAEIRVNHRQNIVAVNATTRPTLGCKTAYIHDRGLCVPLRPRLLQTLPLQHLLSCLLPQWASLLPRKPFLLLLPAPPWPEWTS